MQTQWINQIRALLARASDQHSEALAGLDALKSSIDAALLAATQPAPGAPNPVARKHLIAQIRLKSRYYGLSEEVQAFVYAAGHQVLQELDTDQLGAVLAWVNRQIDRAEAACDPEPAPPAR